MPSFVTFDETHEFIFPKPTPLETMIAEEMRRETAEFIDRVFVNTWATKPDHPKPLTIKDILRAKHTFFGHPETNPTPRGEQCSTCDEVFPWILGSN
jgi:hypothetical protein